MADGLLSPDDMMLMDAGLLFDPAMVDAYASTSDAMAIPETAAMMMPSSGFAEMMGVMPDPSGQGYLPSMADLIAQGDFQGLGYQLLGVSGDVMYAMSPFTGGLLVLPATAAKTARASRVAHQTQKLESLTPNKKFLPNASTKKDVKFTVGENVSTKEFPAELEEFAEIQDIKSIKLSSFDVPADKASEKLTDQIKKSKTIDPITVIQDAEGFRVLDGEKRVAAMKELGYSHIPAKIAVDLKNPPFKATANFELNISKGSEAEKILQQDALQHGRDMAEGKVPMQNFGKQTKHDIPFSEYSAETTATQTLDDSLLFDPQENVGRMMKLMPSDITGGGYQIDSVMGQQLTRPTQMQGGVDFRLMGDEAWKSIDSVISGMKNEASKYDDGILGVVSNMGGRSNDFSHHVTDTMIDLARQNAKSVDPAIIDMYDDEVRKLVPKGKTYSGLLSPKLDEELYSLDPDVRLSGAVRKGMANIMDKASYRDAGLIPSMGAIRYAVTRPDLRYSLLSADDSLNPTGFGLVNIAPNAAIRTVDDIFPQSHKTYLTGIEGTNAGKMTTPIPRKFWTPDFFEQQRAYGTEPKSMRRSAETSNVTQLLTQQIADNLNNYDYYYKKGLLGY